MLHIFRFPFSPHMKYIMLCFRPQTCWYLPFFHLPNSWNLGLTDAFVENLESTDRRPSYHSIGRTRPHRPETALAKKTNKDTQTKEHETSQCVLIYSPFLIVYHRTTDVQWDESEWASKWDTEGRKGDVMRWYMEEARSNAWWAKPNSG